MYVYSTNAEKKVLIQFQGKFNITADVEIVCVCIRVRELMMCAGVERLCGLNNSIIIVVLSLYIRTCYIYNIYSYIGIMYIYIHSIHTLVVRLRLFYT